MNDVATANESGRRARRSGFIAAATFLVALLTACSGDGKKMDPTPTPDASATAAALATASAPSPTPSTPPEPSFGDVVWATAIDPQTGAPAETVDAFTTDARTIYAVLLVRNLPPNTALTADWTYNHTSLDGLTTNADVASSTEETWVEFHLTRSDEPWPAGTYAISVSVDSQVVGTADVEVTSP